MAEGQRPDSTLSEQSVGSSSGAGASTGSLSRRPGTSQRPRAHPGGPRRPSAKASLPSTPAPTLTPAPAPAPTSRPQQEQHQQRRQSQNDQPPSYTQSQSLHESHQRPSQSYTPPPTSAVTSDSSCSHPPTSVFTRADTPSSMSALSPVRATTSPQPMLEPLKETSAPAHHTRASLPLTPTIAHDAHAQLSRSSAPTIPSDASKPPTTAPPINNRSLIPPKPRMITTLPMPTPLQPPPSIDFSPVSVPFKALTLDAAQWTFSSAELQAIVSRAIRASAEPSSIRLLPLQTLDEELVQELERLESERAQATAQYRFAMHRRTMLLQSLNASASPSSASTSTPNTINLNLSITPTLSPAGDIAQRLAEVSATLDRLAVTLVRISDQIAQIRSLQDVHAASALAVALRKLNASYARRTREVQSLKEKLVATEDERDEAWRVAEELAMEFDGEGEGAYDDDDIVEGRVVNGERAVAVPATLTRASRLGVKIKTTGVGPRMRQPESGTDAGRENDNGNGNGNDPAEAEANVNSHAESQSSAVDAGAGTGEPESATATTPIARRKRANSATSRVTAARTRSLRTSKASLRFPRSRKPSSASRPTSTYSQHSTQSGHGAGGGGGAGSSSRPRSRSRANSTSSVREASPTSTNAHSHAHGAGTGITIPDVPKIPNATELARLASVKSTASTGSTSTSTTAIVPPIPPVPPPKIETSPSKIGPGSGSFLDMTTRPNSATDEKGTSPSPHYASPPSDAVAVDGNSQSSASDTKREGEEVLNRGESAQVDGVATRTGHCSLVDGNERCRDADTGRAEGDEGQVINVPSRLTSPQPAPFPSSRIDSKNSPSTKLHPEVGTTQNILATRSSLHVYPSNWTRPPPDSPVDVTRGSGPHRADNGVDDDVVVSDSDNDNDEEEEEDEEERELRDAFENAYSKAEMHSTRTHTRARMGMGVGNVRSPMRTQHTQSMLPFPGSSSSSTLGPGPGPGSGTGATPNTAAFVNLNVDSRPGITEHMRRSPASDNQIPRSGPARSFLGAAAAASSNIKRPASLPSAQAERPPWDYF